MKLPLDVRHIHLSAYHGHEANQPTTTVRSDPIIQIQKTETRRLGPIGTATHRLRSTVRTASHRLYY